MPFLRQKTSFFQVKIVTRKTCTLGQKSNFFPKIKLLMKLSNLNFRAKMKILTLKSTKIKNCKIQARFNSFYGQKIESCPSVFFNAIFKNIFFFNFSLALEIFFIQFSHCALSFVETL